MPTIRSIDLRPEPAVMAWSSSAGHVTLADILTAAGSADTLLLLMPAGQTAWNPQGGYFDEAYVLYTGLSGDNIKAVELAPVKA
jgi:hypothetical protein